MRASGRKRPQFASPLTSIEICAGAGGQAVGLHNAGFDHRALVEWDQHAVKTLSANVAGWPGWDAERANRLEPMDVKSFLKSDVYKELGLEQGELDLLAGGVPCPPFSLAGKQLGRDDERDLFPAALEIIDALRPKAVMIENVRGILEPPEVFIEYRAEILRDLGKLGYVVPRIEQKWSPVRKDQAMRRVWRRMDAKDFGVPQLRPRAILVVIHETYFDDDGAGFSWPTRLDGESATVADALKETMEERLKPYWDKVPKGLSSKSRRCTGQDVFKDWLADAEKAAAANRGVAPTLVGGSRKHGGADLGPTRAKKAWESLGVNAMGLANDPERCDPERDLFRHPGPMLTVEQAAIIQGFPRGWKFQGKKTARYRQVGNAFPPPVAEAVGRAIAAVLRPECREELLADYVMGSDQVIPVSGRDGEQLEFPGSDVSRVQASSSNSFGDLVSAGA
ncbi:MULTISPECIES: DNA (cytosine-5-)-methyltransferase [Streptomyces]|uniref:DNA cytosine methyltransferase n=1 Tax=Streptomyces TaxID=1883 RepID=UPI00240DE023|nr:MULTISPECIES: DNA (cytosine-5-)-methyltransferase [Streptomyces]WFB86818.1 DNA (cytosine-5-)-methyltransferase [Streptomyces olivaceus]WGK46416.1 DNA (cytosine-5-)-methyltransferase [Streptomyces sp. B146]